jgi:hypothetical protein
MAREAFKDPLDEEILWHLGVGEARQPRREIVPTTENVERVSAKRNWVRLPFFPCFLLSYTDP